MPRLSGLQAPMPVLLALVAPALLAACSNDPLSYIPAQDRAFLQAQRRLGDDGSPSGGPISVDALLDQARASGAADTAAATASRVALRYEGDAVQPDAGQREVIHRFAAEAREQGLHVTVVSRQDSFDAPGGPLLGQRRAAAVARELETLVPDVDLRFDPGAPPGVVVLSGGRGNRSS
jgi:hypothetical protein